jgi:antitoxin MazE
LETAVETENNVILSEYPRRESREGWAQASRIVAEVGDDVLVMDEFPNHDDADLAW